MKFPTLLFTLYAAAVSFGAELELPAERLPATNTWALSGVPGGIPERTTIHATIETTGDTTDRTSEIQTQISAASSGTIVKLGLGNFTTTGQLTIGFQDNGVELRGTLNADGSWGTVLDCRGSAGVQLGTQANFDYPVVTPTIASLTKGATSLTVPDSSLFENGQLIRITIENEGTTPVYSTFGYGSRRGQMAKIKDSGGKPNSTTIVIEDPGLHFDFSGATSAQIAGAALKTVGSGIRDIRITGVNAGVQNNFGINVENAYGCYLYNVKVEEFDSTPVRWADSLNCEQFQFWAGATDGSTSSYGTLVEYHTTSLRIHNSVFVNSLFGIYQQITTSGNVYAYNCIVKESGPELERYSTLNVNHGPWSQGTLIEGNVASVKQNDGYFGGTGYTLTYRNWFMGAALSSSTSYYSYADNRLSRNEMAVGNVFGRTGVGGGNYSTGNPNFGNGYSTGTSSMLGILSTLTTRTSASAGVITTTSGHGIEEDDVIDVYWAFEYDTEQRSSHIRYGMTVVAVTATTVEVSGGSGADLPAEDEEIYVPTSNLALVDYPLDFDSTTGGPMMWTGVLTTRTDGDNGVITLDTGLGTSLNTSRLVAFPVNVHTLMNTTLDLSLANFITISGVSGDLVTINDSSSDLPAEDTAVVITPGPAGFQELDLDVLKTLYAKANYHGLASGSGIPAWESIGSDTLPNSMFLSSAPSYFTAAGMTWPPIDPTSPVTDDYEQNPAGRAFLNGKWETSGEGGGGGSSSGTANIQTFNVGTAVFP